jgi:hypothetical protein
VPISANYAEFLAYEAEAVRCFEYQPLLIPALLQTEDYARAITGPGFAALGPDQVDSLTEVRIRRQERLREDETITLDAVVTEAALRLQVGGPDVMRSSYTANNGNCVEVAGIPGGAGIAVRDSKNVDIPATRVSRRAWSAFLASVAEDTLTA